MHFVGWLPNGVDDRRVSERLKAAGVVAPALSNYCLKTNRKKRLILGYAAFTEAEINKGVQRLARVLIG